MAKSHKGSRSLLGLLTITLTVCWSGAAYCSVAVGNLLDPTGLSQLPEGTKFQIPQDLSLKSSAGNSLNENNTTIFALKGNILGSSQFFVDPGALGFAITRDDLKDALSKAIGADSPDSGMYCFINTAGAKKLIINGNSNGNSVTVPAGLYTLKGCIDKEAVSSSNGSTTKNFSFNLFGKTNKSTLSTCYMTSDADDPSGQSSLYTLGCVAYRLDGVATTTDFLRAFGVSSDSFRFADPRSPEQIDAEKAQAAEAKRIADQKAAEKAAEDAKREQQQNEIADRYESSRGWSDEVLRKMPKVDDSNYLKMAQDHPEVAKLHDACMDDYLLGALKFSSMPQSCIDFFKVWKK